MLGFTMNIPRLSQNIFFRVARKQFSDSCMFVVKTEKLYSSRPRHEQHLVRWAGCQLHDIESLSKMVDPSIRGQCSEKVLSRFADIISRCIQVIHFCSSNA